MSKVLLIDDEDKFRTNLAKRLNLHGYETVDLDSGTEAVKLVRSDSDIDVVILDLKMPGMSGDQVLREIKRFHPELQVIMLTGYGSLDSAVECTKLGAFDYLPKPYELERLPCPFLWLIR